MKYFTVTLHVGHATVTPVSRRDIGGFAEVAMSRGKYGWSVTALVQARSKDAAIPAAWALWRWHNMDNFAMMAERKAA